MFLLFHKQLSGGRNVGYIFYVTDRGIVETQRFADTDLILLAGFLAPAFEK